MELFNLTIYTQLLISLTLSFHIGSVYSLPSTDLKHTHQPLDRLATFSLKFLEFHNHAHRRIDGSCCGRHKQSSPQSSISTFPSSSATSVMDICKAECALEFRICIEPYTISVPMNSIEIYSGPCLYGETRTGHWGNTDITYELLEASIHTIGITRSWPSLFTVILEAYDLVSQSEKYLIDRAVHRGLLRPQIYTKQSNLTSEWHQVTISTQYSGYTFCMRLTCEPNHYGNGCTKVCLINESQTRYKCDPNGDKICEPGWSGVECDKAICNVGCHPVHGSCSRPGECECATGWQGPLCDECIKYPGCKHGTCNDAPFTCRCLPNWGGPFCDQDLDYCGRHQPCLNNGICKNLNSSYSKPFNCSCTQDFTGDYCEIKLAPCTVNPCKRGQCISRDNVTYECNCEPGWRGDHCEENIDYCLINTCLNGGTCQDLDGPGFQCLCPPGFKGSNCQLPSPCSNSQCVHARDCKQLIQPVNGIDYECNCQPGWTGQFCDENIDDCVGKCQNGGTCHDLLDDFYCTCPVGFEGRYCEINRECSSKPCKNKGICHEIPGGYRCECPNEFMGQNCEISLNGCNPNLCQNGAYCYTLPNGFYCKCPEKFYGQFCEHQRPYCGPDGCDALTDPCLNMLLMTTSISSIPSSELAPESAVTMTTTTNSISYLNNSNKDDILVNTEITYPYGICGPHGTCVTIENGDYSCVCSTGFQGKYCHQPINYCEINPCMHGATCVNGLESYECICEEGFSGTQCEKPIDLCQPNPCQNGGYCQHTLHPGDFQCRCAPGWSGRWCEFHSDNPCSVSKICFNNGKCHQDHLSPGLFRCECDHQWMGSVCQLRRPESRACVQETLCKNGATCVDLGNSFNCICRPGFDGQYCENDINECNSMPCYNNGTCRDLINSFECDCPKGFIGTDCRINVNECASHPCAYGATCIDRVGAYECICPERRYGQHCEEVIIETEPKPPACNFYGRIYDHNDNWTYSCQRCHCNTGQIICTDDFCGYWSCLQASGQNDRFACKDGEICHILSSGLESDCFIPPCYLRTVCLNASQSIPEQLQTLLPNFYFPPALPGCRPNGLILNNRCARILLRFSKLRMSYATTVGDVCNAVKSLPSLRKYHQHGVDKQMGIGISCDIKAGYSSEFQSTIEITLSSPNDQLKISSDGKEYSFIHELARNLSKEAALAASTNITTLHKTKLNKQKHHHQSDHIPFSDHEHDDNADDSDDEDIPLPPMTMMLGSDQLDKYWHRILLGIIEIQVDTMVVNESDFGSRLLVPIVCTAILLITLICTFVICCYSQRKRRELIMKYAPKATPNNQTSNFIQYFSENNSNNNNNNNHNNNTNYNSNKLTNQINASQIPGIGNTNQRCAVNYPQLISCDTRRFISPQFINVNRNILLQNTDNNNNNNNNNSNKSMTPGTNATNRVGMNKTSVPVVI
ncbi:unnamed protein product [Trichobilharzia szidati]|nr:unnamed protein product [Trichobilharzia szidati]